MKLLFDFLPIILFFAAYKLSSIYIATGVAIAVSVLLIGWIYLKGNKPDVMQWVSLAVIIVFGGATIILHNEIYIKWKPTVLYLLTGGILACAQLIFNKNLLKLLMEKQTAQPGQAPIMLPDFVWTKLIWMWVVFFAFMAALNLYVAFNFSMDSWVNFKMFGGIGLMVVFIIIQSIYMARHVQDGENTPDPKTQTEL